MKVFSCLTNKKFNNTLKSLGFVLNIPSGDILKDIKVIKEAEIFISDTLDALFWVSYSYPSVSRRYTFIVGVEAPYPDIKIFETPEDILAHMVEISPLNLINLKDVGEELKALQQVCRHILFALYDKVEENPIVIDKTRTEKLSARTGVSLKDMDKEIEITYTSKKVGDKCF